MSDHEADDPALAGFITLQKERFQSLTRLQQNYKNLWWHGPSWLRQHSSEWPDTEVPNMKFDEQSLEAKSLRIRLHTTQVDINIIERFSTYTKLVRVIAYILRFCHNTQSKKTRSQNAVLKQKEPILNKIN